MEKGKERENVTCSTDPVLEDLCTESQSDSSKPSTSETEETSLIIHSKPAANSPWSEFLQLLRVKSQKHLSKLHLLHPLNTFKLSKRFDPIASDQLVDVNTTYFKPQWKNFSYKELQASTSNFFQGYLIGKGGYAEVYRGRLCDGQLVAIKRLTKGPLEERIGDFLSELGTMAHINHPNTAKLIGYCVEGGMFLLVLEFSPIGSLASLLHGSRKKVMWDVRYKVALGTAKGLLYLHEGCQRRIIHRDIKAANILLTEDFEPQICDFGLAKWLPDRWTHLTVSKFEGTFGYLAPEFLMHGIVDEKTDVFAFGVLLLELITGHRALDYSRQSLVMWAKPLLKKNKVEELIDPAIAEENDSVQLNLMLLAASLFCCCLEGVTGSVDMIGSCKKLSSCKKYYKELFSAERYDCTTGGI